MSNDISRDAMAEIIGVLKKYDLAGAVTIVSKERAAFKYHFPTWSAAQICEASAGISIRLSPKREDYVSREEQRKVAELTAHIIYQMRDVAVNTVGVCGAVAETMEKAWDVKHTPRADFDPERTN